MERLINHHSSTCRVVACETFEFPPQRGALENIHERLGLGQLQGLATKDKVVALTMHWNEVQAERSGR